MKNDNSENFFKNIQKARKQSDSDAAVDLRTLYLHSEVRKTDNEDNPVQMYGKTFEGKLSESIILKID
jgi:hypothetical protein